jgi:hypothetical protein
MANVPADPINRTLMELLYCIPKHSFLEVMKRNNTSLYISPLGCFGCAMLLKQLPG